ncbi:hypothetical protein K6U57_09120, partial [Vibrio alginolyticus]
ISFSGQASIIARCFFIQFFENYKFYARLPSACPQYCAGDPQYHVQFVIDLRDCAGQSATADAEIESDGDQHGGQSDVAVGDT